MKSRTKRIAIVALLVLACALVADLIVAQPILNKGIVIGMGIDRTEEGKIDVTIQIAVAGESSAPGAPNRYAIVSGEAPTLLGAMDEIARITAYKPAYFHCHLLLVGEKLFREGLREVMTELFVKDSVMDDVAIMAVEGTAKETIKRSVSMQGAASVYLQQLNKINSSTGGHPTATLRSLVTAFETKGYTPYLPLVRAIPVPKAIGGADTGRDEQNYAFDCSRTVLFTKEGIGSVEEEETTVAIGLTGQTEGMILPIKTDEGYMDIFVKKSLHLWHIEKSGKVTLCALYFVNVAATDLAESPADLPEDFVTEAVGKYVKRTILAAYMTGTEKGVDPYSLKGKYHKKYGDEKEPSETALEVKVTVRTSNV